jgi:protein tyrosine phosphatase
MYYLLLVCLLIFPLFADLKEEVEQRWLTFQKERVFKPFTPGKSDADLRQEFDELHNIRTDLWTTDGYQFADHLIANDLIRAPGCVAFDYNNTVPTYNASTIWIGNRRYIACEGPRSKDISSFFDLIKSQSVTHLIRLTDSHEGDLKKCHPYWDGLLIEGTLQIPTDTGSYSVSAFDMAHWRDNQGVDPAELLAVVLKVREAIADEKSLLLVHCSAGVGRTGTFLAALAIVDAIDRKEPFSIEEIVYRLSLQRVHSVGKSSQYITLHRLAEKYAEHL